MRRQRRLGSLTVTVERVDSIETGSRREAHFLTVDLGDRRIAVGVGDRRTMEVGFPDLPNRRTFVAGPRPLAVAAESRRI
jgi:hypothetical protein